MRRKNQLIFFSVRRPFVGWIRCVLGPTSIFERRTEQPCQCCRLCGESRQPRWAPSACHIMNYRFMSEVDILKIYLTAKYVFGKYAADEELLKTESGGFLPFARPFDVAKLVDGVKLHADGNLVHDIFRVSGVCIVLGWHAFALPSNVRGCRPKKEQVLESSVIPSLGAKETVRGLLTKRASHAIKIFVFFHFFFSNSFSVANGTHTHTCPHSGALKIPDTILSISHPSFARHLPLTTNNTVRPMRLLASNSTWQWCYPST